jgi:hypothetical protein
MKLEKPSLDRPEFKERVKVPVYGDEKIDQAKGKYSRNQQQPLFFDLTHVGRLHRADAQTYGQDDYVD